MTDLSPGAQAVWDAWEKTPVSLDIVQSDRDALAAALRAAADQAQACLIYTTPPTDWSKGWKEGVSDAAQGFLAIADELENRNA